MLVWRLIFAAAFLVPLTSLLAVDFFCSGAAPGIWLLPVLLFLVICAAGEFVELVSPRTHRPHRWLVQIGSSLVALSSAAPLAWALAGEPYPPDCPIGKLGWPLSATAFAVTCVLIVEMSQFGRPGTHLIRVAIATFGIIYIGLFLSFLYPLRSLHGNAWGMVAFLSLLLIVKMSDVGAYTIGKLFGRTKLIPHLSPGKTVEGAVGGLATAALVSWIFFTWAAPLIVGGGEGVDVWRSPGWRSVVYGLTLAIAALVGDLAESLIKRDMQRKDSSHWVRGLGGILDLLDSVIVASPVAYACWSVGLVGP